MSTGENKIEKCACGKQLKRSHTIDDMVMWACDDPKCDHGEIEDFRDLDDEGWKWLRQYYQSYHKESL